MLYPAYFSASYRCHICWMLIECQNLKTQIIQKTKEIQKIEGELKRNQKNNHHLIDLQKLNFLSAKFLINYVKVQITLPQFKNS